MPAFDAPVIAIPLILIAFAMYAAAAHFVRALWLLPFYPPGILVVVTWMCFLTTAGIAASAPLFMSGGGAEVLFFLCIACPVAAANLLGGCALAVVVFLSSFRVQMSDWSL